MIYGFLMGPLYCYLSRYLTSLLLLKNWFGPDYDTKSWTKRCSIHMWLSIVLHMCYHSFLSKYGTREVFIRISLFWTSKRTMEGENCSQKRLKYVFRRKRMHGRRCIRQGNLWNRFAWRRDIQYMKVYELWRRKKFCKEMSAVLKVWGSQYSFDRDGMLVGVAFIYGSIRRVILGKLKKRKLRLF